MTPMTESPLRIQGAGPAGLCAAIVLARAGRAVEVHERHHAVAHRFCGDLHGVENWSETRDCVAELQALGIEISFDFAPSYSFEIGNGRQFRRLSFDRPLFYLVKRGLDAGCLDSGLANQAMALGAKIYYASPLREADADLVASGPAASDVFAYEKGLLFDTDGPDLAAALVHPQAGGDGYAYLLIQRGTGVLCTVAFKQADGIARALDVAQTMFQQRYRFSIESPRSIGGVGACSLQRFASRDGVRRVGEAAGLQDLLFGFGIRNAMVSGALAAHCVLRGECHHASADARFAEVMYNGLVARQLWAGFAYRLFRPLTWRLASSRDPHGLLYRAQRHNRLYAFARWARGERGTVAG